MSDAVELILLPLQPVIDRLKAVAMPPLREVGGAADIQAAVSNGSLRASPSGFVIPMGSQAFEIEEGSGPLRQTIDVTFGVVVGVTLAGKLGAEGLKQAEGPCNAVRGAIFGWQHPDAVRKCWSAGESVEDFNEKTGVLLVRLDFTTRVRIQEG